MELRDVTADDLDEILQVRTRSFGHVSGEDLEIWRREAIEFAEAGRYLCVSVGRRPVAAARIWDFEQFWHGRRVPVAGIASVVVAPEFRGVGVAAQLLRGLHQRAAELDLPLSALYPAAAPLYRSQGYEYAGLRQRWTFPAERLRAMPRGGVQVRRGGPDDAARMLALVEQVRSAGRESGPLLWAEHRVREWLAEQNSFCYLAADGFVVYGWDGRDLTIEELVGASAETTAALLSVVGSGASIAERIHLRAGPHDPVHLVVPDEADHETHTERWMVRLLDAPAAITARGWPAAVSVDTLLRIDDPEVPANRGTWRLTVRDAQAQLTPVGSAGDVLELGARGLAALYAGTPMASLRRSGLAHGGDPAADAALDAAFATAAPYCLDYF